MYAPGKSKAKRIPIQKGKAYASYGSMTYAGFKSMIYATLDKKDPRVQAAYRWIRQHYTLEENYGMGTRQNPEDGQAGLFFYYVTLAKALDVWGEDYVITLDGKKHPWARELADKLLSFQHREGFWVNQNPRWWEREPSLVTAYALTALNICIQRFNKSKRI